MSNGLKTYRSLHMLDTSAKNHLKRQDGDTWVDWLAFLAAASIFAAMTVLAVAK